MVAQRIIQDNFDRAICSLVVEASRLGDGSIRARCNSGETFRVFSVGGVGPVALRCAAAREMGISGC